MKKKKDKKKDKNAKRTKLVLICII